MATSRADNSLASRSKDGPVVEEASVKHSGTPAATAPATLAQTLPRDALAGLVGSIVLIANIVSFAALMFPGAMARGAATAIWAMLIGSGIVGLWVSLRTSLPPLATGMDSPTGAVLVVVAATAGHAVLSAGGTAEQAIEATMLLFTIATALSAILLLGLGTARWGSYLRFVPHFVVAGFLGATGWLLMAGAIRMTTGRSLAELMANWNGAETARLSSALLVFAILMALRRWIRWPLAMPTALITLTLLGSLLLGSLGLATPAAGWYLPSMGTLRPWLPFLALRDAPLSWHQFASFLPELGAVAVVALVSLVTKTSSLEVTRKASGDLDVELRSHGLATLVAVALGGIASSMQMGTSRLLESAGALTRLSGLACALVLTAVGLLNFDLPALIPLPIAAGLVLQLGWGFLVEAFAKPWAQRDWTNLALALIITAVSVRFGYLTGIVGGVVCACLLFALSYARLGVVRQHFSRAQFAGNVSRSAEAMHHLNGCGEAIQIYWLSGYIFFGSSEGVFERVRSDIRSRPPRMVSHVILDFSRVTAADASATVSLAKLRNFCLKQGSTLVFSGLNPEMHRALEREGFFKGQGGCAPFPDVTTALASSEDALLAQAGLGGKDGGTQAGSFEDWLQQQLGDGVRVSDFLPYLERRCFDSGQLLYHQGEAADAIDLVVSGQLAVDVASADAHKLHLRSITTQTVVGEMGFFGRATRSANVYAQGPATVLTLKRTHCERLHRERPDVALAFCEFLLRTLSDRVRVSEKMALALNR